MSHGKLADARVKVRVSHVGLEVASMTAGAIDLDEVSQVESIK